MLSRIAPCAQLEPLNLIERGQRELAYAEAFVAGMSPSVASRELECVGQGLGWSEAQLRMCGLPAEQGPGNALLITLGYEHVTEVFAAFGEKTPRSDAVARRALDEAHRYIASGAAAGEHLADQLMLPMALAGSGSFTCDTVSQHAVTNAEVIGRFLPVDVSFHPDGVRTLCAVKAK